MDINAISNSQIDIQTLLPNNTKGISPANNNDAINKTAYYAKKGEPMYMAEMDPDEDGVVTLDEFKEYCKSQNISSNNMLKMSKAASSFRIMQAETESIDYISKLTPHISPKLKQTDSKSGNIKQNENQYNISNDPNNKKKVGYNEYMEYCEQNAIPNKMKTNTKVEESNNGFLKITNSGKAAESYRNSESHLVKSTFANNA